jgi:hypothetical protein
MTRTRDEIQENRRQLEAEYGKLFDSMHENETNFAAKRCDADSLVSTRTRTRAGYSGPRFPEKESQWMEYGWCFFRGIIFGFLGGIVLIVLFLGSGKYGSLAGIRPIGFLYFLAGLEIGISLIGAIAFFGLQAFHDWGQRELERSKSGGTS